MIRVALAGFFCAISVLLAPPAAAGPSDVLARIGCGAPLMNADRSARPRLSPRVATRGELKILVIGSSSTAGVGAEDPGGAYPALLEKELQARARRRMSRIRVVAKGVSGETAGGALARLEAAIGAEKPDLLVWQVGTNDAIRRVPLAALRETIEIGAAIARMRKLPLILVDPQYLPKVRNNAHYRAVAALMTDLAVELGAPLVRRFERMRGAENIGAKTVSKLLAPDGLHMSPLGHQCLALDLAETIWPKRASRRATGL